MILVYIVGIVILALLVTIFFGRFFAWLVEIFAQFFLHLDLTLDTLGLFAASGIKIRLNNGLKIGIEKICLHCKWTLNDSKRLFTVVFRSVVIEVKKGNVNTNLHQHRDPSTSSRSSSKFIAVHKQTITRLLRKCCQYIGIQVSSIEVLLSSQPSGSITKCSFPDGVQFYSKPEND
ncbi:uncharacterized protein LOC110064417 [Orbicella faveolata]|uniref:uncharacterized protein LOC110064417 n=1 Tax=Orbicella faveolata TaxID=48498 RepID=UPI0009E60E5F|nr:uncharacterized protein LOC110064417 [Orbicella faveolata]